MSNQHKVVYVDLILQPLLPNFIQNRWNDLELLKKFLQESDFNSIDHLIHKLQGTAGTFGFNDLVQFAKNLNIAVQSKDFIKIKSILSDYELFMNNFKIEFIS